MESLQFRRKSCLSSLDFGKRGARRVHRSRIREDHSFYRSRDDEVEVENAPNIGFLTKNAIQYACKRLADEWLAGQLTIVSMRYFNSFRLGLHR